MPGWEGGLQILAVNMVYFLIVVFVKVSCRVFAMEIMGELLSSPVRQPPPDSLSAEVEHRLSYLYLLRIVIFQCSDVSSK